MTSVRVQVIGAKKAARRLKHIPSAAELALRDVLFQAATRVQEEALAEIVAPKHGRIYTKRRRGGGFITWQASAPGEPPARKTGERMARIKPKKANRKFKPQSHVVAPGIYKLLERGLGNIARRPLFGPLFKMASADVQRFVTDEVRKSVRQAARK